MWRAQMPEKPCEWTKVSVKFSKATAKSIVDHPDDMLAEAVFEGHRDTQLDELEARICRSSQ